MKATIGLECTCRTKDCLPLGCIDGSTHIGHAWKEDMILDIQDPGGLVRALEELAQVDEFVPLVAGKGGSGESLEEV